jgi:hypothetical protein
MCAGADVCGGCSGSAFMSFMAVAYCPAYLEDYTQYVKEKHNGLYGATELIVSNFFIGIPYLCKPSLLPTIAHVLGGC